MSKADFDRLVSLLEPMTHVSWWASAKSALAEYDRECNSARVWSEYPGSQQERAAERAAKHSEQANIWRKSAEQSLNKFVEAKTLLTELAPSLLVRLPRIEHGDDLRAIDATTAANRTLDTLGHVLEVAKGGAVLPASMDDLTGMQRDVLAAMKGVELNGPAIAAAAGYEYDGVRRALGVLKQLGWIKKTSHGYMRLK